MPEQSPSQTVGPFFHDCLIDGDEHVLVDDQTMGRPHLIHGRVLDGDGAPVPDALVEIWQADARGLFNHPSDPHQARADAHFRGFGRSPTAEDGRFFFHTVKPGVRPGQATPFINVRVFARGLLIDAVTRLYFPDEPGNDHDPVLQALPADRRETLVAVGDAALGQPAFRFDIRLQGEGETVFFDL